MPFMCYIAQTFADDDTTSDLPSSAAGRRHRRASGLVKAVSSPVIETTSGSVPLLRLRSVSMPSMSIAPPEEPGENTLPPETSRGTASSDVGGGTRSIGVQAEVFDESSVSDAPTQASPSAASMCTSSPHLASLPHDVGALSADRRRQGNTDWASSLALDASQILLVRSPRTSSLPHYGSPPYLPPTATSPSFDSHAFDHSSSDDDDDEATSAPSLVLLDDRPASESDALWADLEARLGQRISLLDSYNPWSFLPRVLASPEEGEGEAWMMVQTPPLRYRKKEVVVLRHRSLVAAVEGNGGANEGAGCGCGEGGGYRDRGDADEGGEVEGEGGEGKRVMESESMQKINTQIEVVRKALREDSEGGARRLPRSGMSMFRVATATGLGLEVQERSPAVLIQATHDHTEDAPATVGVLVDIAECEGLVRSDSEYSQPSEPGAHRPVSLPTHASPTRRSAPSSSPARPASNYVPALDMIDTRLWTQTTSPPPTAASTPIRPSALPQLKRAQRPPPLVLRPVKAKRTQTQTPPASARKSRIPVRTPLRSSPMLATPSTSGRSASSESSGALSTPGTSFAGTPQSRGPSPCPPPLPRSAAASPSPATDLDPFASAPDRKLKRRSTVGDVRRMTRLLDGFPAVPPLPKSRLPRSEPPPPREATARTGEGGRGRSLTMASRCLSERRSMVTLKPASAYAPHELPWIRGGGATSSTAPSSPVEPPLPSSDLVPLPASAPVTSTPVSPPPASRHRSQASIGTVASRRSLSNKAAPLPPGLQRHHRSASPQTPVTVDRSRTLAERKFEEDGDASNRTATVPAKGKKAGFRMRWVNGMRKHKQLDVPPTMSFFED